MSGLKIVYYRWWYNSIYNNIITNIIIVKFLNRIMCDNWLANIILHIASILHFIEFKNKLFVYKRTYILIRFKITINSRRIMDNDNNTFICNISCIIMNLCSCEKCIIYNRTLYKYIIQHVFKDQIFLILSYLPYSICVKNDVN